MTQQIDLRGLIAGYPAKDVRRLMQIASWRPVSPELVAKRLRIESAAGREAVGALVTRGLLKPYERGDGEASDFVVATEAGSSLASAKAGPRVQRATAERWMVGVMERARVLAGRDHPFAFILEELLVFGSYLTDAPTLGDLDLAARWRPRLADRDAQMAYRQQRVDLAQAEGKRFAHFLAELEWPRVEVWRYLRGGVSRISLQDLDDNGDFVRGVPHQQLL